MAQRWVASLTKSMTLKSRRFVARSSKKNGLGASAKAVRIAGARYVTCRMIRWGFWACFCRAALVFRQARGISMP